MSQITLGLLLAGIPPAAVAKLLWKRRPWWRLPAALVFAAAAALLLGGAGYSFWYHHRPRPRPVQQTLFAGVEYTRQIRLDPRPMVVHLVRVDLQAEGIELLVTPPKPTGGRALAGQTTSQFLASEGVQVAVNASPFRPWHAQGPFDYYPHSGDPVDPLGLTVSRGRRYSEPARSTSPVSFSRDNRVAMGEEMPEVWNVVCGFHLLVRDGQVTDVARSLQWNRLHPRTGCGIDRSGRYLLLIVVDGRQPNYSEGATPSELAALAMEFGAHTLMNMDGGGSTTLVVQRPDGRPKVLNSPIHGRVPPGRERPVAAHLGIFARPPE